MKVYESDIHEKLIEQGTNERNSFELDLRSGTNPYSEIGKNPQLNFGEMVKFLIAKL